MRMLTLLILAPAAALAAGCGDPNPPGLATTPEQSRAVLTAVLDAWKAGKNRADLKAQTPPIYFSDDAMDRRKLTDYAIEGDGSAVGTGLRYDVTLTTQDGDKPAAQRKVAYRIVTEPNISVSKEDF